MINRIGRALPTWPVCLLLVLLAGLAFYLMKPAIAGFLYDDGMYLMAAKALATGHGYRLMDIAGQPLFYKYPPLYPLALAGMWLLHPQFPANIVWLKSLNIVLLLGSLVLLDYYYRKHQHFSGWVSLGLLAWLGTNWRLIEVSIEMMSEPLFLLLTTLTLVVLDAARPQSPDGKLSRDRLCLLIGLSVAACYTRAIGLALIAGIGIWLFLQRNRRQAAGYLTACLLLVSPWFMWSASRPDTTHTIGNFMVRSFQETYGQSFRMDMAYEATFPGLLAHGFRELVSTAAMQVFPGLERLQGLLPASLFTPILLVLSFSIVLLLGFSVYRAYKTRKISPDACYVLAYLAVLLGWSFYQCYPRFIVVILPFLLAFLLKAIQQSIQSTHTQTRIIALLIFVGLISNGLHLSTYLAKANANTLAVNTNANLWGDYSQIIQFISEKTPKNAIIYTDNADEAYLYALHTHRKTLDLFLYLPTATIDRHCARTTKACLMDFYAQNADALWQVLQQHQVDYIIANRVQITRVPAHSGYLIPKTTPTTQLLLKKHAVQLITVAQTADGWITAYEVRRTSATPSHTAVPSNQ